MPEPVSVRVARAGYETALGGFWRASIVDDDLAGFNTGDIDRLVHPVATTPDGLLVATGGDDLLGFVDVVARMLLVRPAWLGRGLGRLLLQMVVARLTAAGHRSSERSVESKNGQTPSSTIGWTFAAFPNGSASGDPATPWHNPSKNSIDCD